VTLESLSEFCFRNYKEDNKIRTRRLALKNAKYLGALQKFSLHHNLSSFELSLNSGNIVKPFKLTRSQQSRPFGVRSTLAFCERFKYDMKINGRVIK